MTEMLWCPDPPVETARLILRPYQTTDLETLYALHSRPEVVRYVSWPAHTDQGDSRQMLAARMAVSGLAGDGDKLVLAAELKESGKLVGEIALILVNRAALQGEIGFILHPRYQGMGFAYEGARAILDVGFHTVGFHRIIGRCDARNQASAGLMAKLGMRQEAHFRQAEFIKGEWIDRLIFARLADEHLSAVSGSAQK